MQYFTSSVMLDFSAAQEKLAVRLVVVVETSAAVEFLSSFCAFWDLLFLNFYLKVGGHFLNCHPIPTWINH